MDSYIASREAQDRARVSTTATEPQLRARLSELSRLPSTPDNIAERGAVVRRLADVGRNTYHVPRSALGALRAFLGIS